MSRARLPVVPVVPPASLTEDVAAQDPTGLTAIPEGAVLPTAPTQVQGTLVHPVKAAQGYTVRHKFGSSGASEPHLVESTSRRTGAPKQWLGKQSLQDDERENTIEILDEAIGGALLHVLDPNAPKVALRWKPKTEAYQKAKQRLEAAERKLEEHESYGTATLAQEQEVAQAKRNVFQHSPLLVLSRLQENSIDLHKASKQYKKTG